MDFVYHTFDFRLYIEFQKDQATGRQEALIALMEVDDVNEVGELRSVLPDLLKSERDCKETYHHYLKNALLSSVGYGGFPNIFMNKNGNSSKLTTYYKCIFMLQLLLSN